MNQPIVFEKTTIFVEGEEHLAFYVEIGTEDPDRLKEAQDTAFSVNEPADIVVVAYTTANDETAFAIKMADNCEVSAIRLASALDCCDVVTGDDQSAVVISDLPVEELLEDWIEDDFV